MEQSTRKQIWKIELRIFAEFEKFAKNTISNTGLWAALC